MRIRGLCTFRHLPIGMLRTCLSLQEGMPVAEASRHCPEHVCGSKMKSGRQSQSDKSSIPNWGISSSAYSLLTKSISLQVLQVHGLVNQAGDPVSSGTHSSGTQTSNLEQSNRK